MLQKPRPALRQNARPCRGRGVRDRLPAMKTFLVNGSPRQNGNTSVALAEIAKTLEVDGIETETFWIGVKPVRGCIVCGKCREMIRLP